MIYLFSLSEVGVTKAAVDCCGTGWSYRVPRIVFVPMHYELIHAVIHPSPLPARNTESKNITGDVIHYLIL